MDKSFYISVISTDLSISSVRKAGLKMLFLLCEQKIRTLKNQLSSRSAALLPLPPLRTVRESFPSYGSSNSKFLFRNRLKILTFIEVITSSVATVMDKELDDSSINRFLGQVPRLFLVNWFSTDWTHTFLFLP